jgi:hypothetical protein
MEHKGNHPAKTMLTLTVALLLAGLIRKWDWALKAAIVAGVAGILSDVISEKIDWAWMRLSRLLANIIPPLMLGLVFYVFIFPVSVLFRVITGKDPLLLRHSAGSTFRETRKEFDKPSFERTW